MAYGREGSTSCRKENEGVQALFLQEVLTRRREKGGGGSYSTEKRGGGGEFNEVAKQTRRKGKKK